MKVPVDMKELRKELRFLTFSGLLDKYVEHKIVQMLGAEGLDDAVRACLDAIEHDMAQKADRVNGE